MLQVMSLSLPLPVRTAVSTRLAVVDTSTSAISLTAPAADPLSPSRVNEPSLLSRQLINLRLPLPARHATTNLPSGSATIWMTSAAPAWSPLSPLRVMGPPVLTSQLISFRFPAPVRQATTCFRNLAMANSVAAPAWLPLSPSLLTDPGEWISHWISFSVPAEVRTAVTTPPTVVTHRRQVGDPPGQVVAVAPPAKVQNRHGHLSPRQLSALSDIERYHKCISRNAL